MPRFTDLLADTRHEGYPADFLLARLGSRRERFAASCPAGGPEAAWRQLQGEYSWLYARMDLPLRVQLAPLFCYFELKNLFAALRFAEALDRIGQAEALESSLLSVPLKNILQSQTAFTSMVKSLNEYLAPFFSHPGILVREYGRGGLAALEKAILAGFLAAFGLAKPPREVAGFFHRLLEIRDLVLLAKQQRWQLENVFIASPLSPIRRRQLQRAWPAGESDPGWLENQLLGALALDSRRQGRRPAKLSRLIDYIWSCYLAARNCGLKGLESLLGENRIQEETV